MEETCHGYDMYEVFWQNSPVLLAAHYSPSFSTNFIRFTLKKVTDASKSGKILPSKRYVCCTLAFIGSLFQPFSLDNNFNYKQFRMKILAEKSQTLCLLVKVLGNSIWFFFVPAWGIKKKSCRWFNPSNKSYARSLRSYLKRFSFHWVVVQRYCARLIIGGIQVRAQVAHLV